MISIIIPCYNYEQYIGDCLDSCMMQDYLGEYEVTVIDDGSTDNSLAVIKQFQNAYPTKVRCRTNVSNMGYSYSKNYGIGCSAHCDYFVHIDADDMLTPWSLSVRAKVLDENPDIDVVHGQAKILRGDEGINDVVNMLGKFRTHPSYIHAQGVMLRRRVFEKYGLYYEPLRRGKGDKEYWQRIGIYKSCNKPYKNWQKDPAKDKKIKDIVAFYRIHGKGMKAQRRRDAKKDRDIQDIFDRRIRQIRREGITKENTAFLV